MGALSSKEWGGVGAKHRQALVLREDSACHCEDAQMQWSEVLGCRIAQGKK